MPLPRSVLLGLRLLLALASFALAAPIAQAAPSSTPLPANSVYRIPVLALRDQNNQHFEFASLRGVPRLVGMFYGSCSMACPIEIESLKSTEDALVEATGKPIPVLLVSFDPGRDDVANLRQVASQHQVSAPLFRLVRPEQGDEGMFAGVLGIAYRALPGGNFSHNVVVALLDGDGRIVATTVASGSPDSAFVKAIINLQRAH